MLNFLYPCHTKAFNVKSKSRVVVAAVVVAEVVAVVVVAEVVAEVVVVVLCIGNAMPGIISSVLLLGKELLYL